VLQAVLGNEELRTSVQTEDLIEHILGDIFLIGEALHARIVDDDVEAGKVRDGGIEEPGHLAGLADIGLDGDGAAAFRLDVGDDRERRFGRSGVVEDDGGAARGEFAGHTGAEAAACAGDEGDAAFERGAGMHLGGGCVGAHCWEEIGIAWIDEVSEAVL
jgi:hypothetical protein